MKNAVVNELISTMREVTPKEGNLANVLMDILCMSKEAIYRRLRGEVAFTFSEVAIIAGQLGISLDKIIGNSMSSGAMFDRTCLIWRIPWIPITRFWCVTRGFFVM